jgi:23S rRNA maturation-related 3'-5' exoribonuclease YhaM
MDDSSNSSQSVQPLRTYQGDVGALEARLDALINGIEDQRLGRLAAKLLDPRTELGRKYRMAPACPGYGHEPYLHGLMHHLVEVAETAVVLAKQTSAMRPTEYPVNLSYVVFGALMHDLGKTSAFQYGDDGFKMSLGGRLNGHLLQSYVIIHNALIESGEFTDDEMARILHLVASHHGPGSDQPPLTMEATIVHTADCFCSQLGSKFGYPHTPPTF